MQPMSRSGASRSSAPRQKTRPTSAALWSTRFSSGSSRSIRAAISACTVSGMRWRASLSSPSTRAISSRKSGLPSARSSTSARCAGGTSLIRASASSSLSRGSSGTRSIALALRMPPPHDERVSSSSGRATAMISTGAVRSDLARCSISSSSGSSAQCTSSKTSTSGCTSASCSAQRSAAQVSCSGVRSPSAAPRTPSATASRSATASLSQQRRSFSNASFAGSSSVIPGARLDHRRERPVGDALAVGKRAPGQGRHALEALDELADEPALSEPGLAEDGDELDAAVADGTAQRVLEQLELAVAADERRADDAVRVVHAKHAPGPQGLGTTSDLDRARVLDLDRPRREAPCARPEQDLARLGRLLEPGREVHGLPGREGRLARPPPPPRPTRLRSAPRGPALRPRGRSPAQRARRARRRPRARSARRTRP